jgi:hypothetical protein
LDKIGGAGEQHPPAVFDESKTERRREMAFAYAGRNSVTMPGVRLSRYGSTIRSILDAARWCRSCSGGGLQARITWSWSSRTARWLWYRAGWQRWRLALSLSPRALGYPSIGWSSCALASMRF